MPKFNETNQTRDTIIYLRLARGQAVLHNFFTKKDTLYHIQLLVGKLNYEYFGILALRYVAQTKMRGKF